MADCMEFPSDWHVFLNEYSFRDTEQKYTNGCLLIPTYRVEQLIEHLLKEQEAEIRQLRLVLDIAKGTYKGIVIEGR